MSEEIAPLDAPNPRPDEANNSSELPSSTECMDSQNTPDDTPKNDEKQIGWSDSSENDCIIEENTEEDTNFFGGARIPKREKSNTTEEDKKIRTESYKILANLGNFGLFLFLAVLFGYYIGKWIDQLFGTKPVFMVMWICFGVAAAGRELYRNIKAAQKIGEDQSDKTRP